MPFDERLKALRDRIAAETSPEPLRLPGAPRASVALIVRPAGQDLELLLMRRAERQGDPWSGHMALPGGRHEPADRNSLATAIRETHEEVGLALRPALALGRLDDVSPGPAAPSIVVTPWAFAAPADTRTRLNHEVDLTFWVPVSYLTTPGATREYLLALAGGDTVRLPAYGYGDHVIWGLTHRIVSSFLRLVQAQDAAGEGR